MKKKRQLFSIAIMAIGLLLFLPVNVKAKEIDSSFIEVPTNQINILESGEKHVSTMSVPSLGVCDLGIGISKNGVGITFTTRATQTATEIGVKDIVLQEKTLLGWKDIPVKDYCDYDTNFYLGSVVYLKAEIDKTYRVYCTHYAIIDEVEYTLFNETKSIVFN